MDIVEVHEMSITIPFHPEIMGVMGLIFLFVVLKTILELWP